MTAPPAYPPCIRPVSSFFDGSWGAFGFCLGPQASARACASLSSASLSSHACMHEASGCMRHRETVTLHPSPKVCVSMCTCRVCACCVRAQSEREQGEWVGGERKRPGMVGKKFEVLLCFSLYRLHNCFMYIEVSELWWCHCGCRCEVLGGWPWTRGAVQRVD
jgi:hypothetical protein